MTLGEKLAQLAAGDGNKGNNSVPRLGVDLYGYHSEGLHGVRTACNDEPGTNTTEFPQVVAMAATGNMPLVKAMAAVVATEARALNNIANGTVFDKGAGLNYWGPTMNLGRDPRWGRFQGNACACVHARCIARRRPAHRCLRPHLSPSPPPPSLSRWMKESVSECPWLNAAYASAVVRGMQEPAPGEPATHITKIAACCKHYYGYSLEGGSANVSGGFTRHTFDAAISKRDLAESYLPAFRACAAAGVAQVM
jgi:beta-glucosidase-like glycosyl hydrolase